MIAASFALWSAAFQRSLADAENGLSDRSRERFSQLFSQRSVTFARQASKPGRSVARDSPGLNRTGPS